MADYSGVISLSQAHISDGDDSSEHSRPSFPTSGGSGGCSNSKAPSDKIDHHPTPSSTSERSTRKPRGRPPGSKNKPKPPVVITRDNDSAMKPVVLEISAGSDIIDTIISFARANRVGITVLSAAGSVSYVTLQYPGPHAPPPYVLHGSFGLLSLSGSYISSSSLSSSNKTPQPSSASSSPSPVTCSFALTIVGAQGHLFGGIVGGKVMAATQVIVVATTFVGPTFHRLPCEDDNEDHHQEKRPGGDGVAAAAVGATEPCSSTGMSMSVYGVPSSIPNVMSWGPSSRPY
ncbi:hypothetical protein PTKIN_Ptkin03bG0094100 [Pterospermum kingtungense]